MKRTDDPLPFTLDQPFRMGAQLSGTVSAGADEEADRRILHEPRRHTARGRPRRGARRGRRDRGRLQDRVVHRHRLVEASPRARERRIRGGGGTRPARRARSDPLRGGVLAEANGSLEIGHAERDMPRTLRRRLAEAALFPGPAPAGSHGRDPGRRDDRCETRVRLRNLHRTVDRRRLAEVERPCVSAVASQ